MYYLCRLSGWRSTLFNAGTHVAPWCVRMFFFFFFFNDTATTEIYTLSLHDALPISVLAPSEASLDALADTLAKARRPLLWLGGGARHAVAAVQRLKALGFGIVSTGQGRGIVAEDDPASLGAYNIQRSEERRVGEECRFRWSP